MKVRGADIIEFFKVWPPGGYGRSRLPGLRMDFLQLVAVHETLEWFATQQPLEHPTESA